MNISLIRNKRKGDKIELKQGIKEWKKGGEIPLLSKRDPDRRRLERTNEQNGIERKDRRETSADIQSKSLCKVLFNAVDTDSLLT